MDERSERPEAPAYERVQAFDWPEGADKIPIDRLVVTQSSVREPSLLPPMVEFVRGGGVFEGERGEKWGGLVVLVRFVDDGRTYVFDGHHRVVACWLGRPDRCLLRREVLLVDGQSFATNRSIVWERGLVYPYEVQSEVRLPEYFAYRARVFELQREEGTAAAEEYIRASKHLYATARRFERVHDLACMLVREHSLPIDLPSPL
eukprot:TRINITY_DN16593_c0_g1_i1.p2 TRINITY_DN16593_c0_g1~~TRINITY_DN16593_c0_g1_i1.p2  ORF type:complete len:231 (+),score=71.94 TRINITY_DN16593_c0_g1_i1:82-693(+)